MIFLKMIKGMWDNGTPLPGPRLLTAKIGK